jgi:hypothetical protein
MRIGSVNPVRRVQASSSWHRLTPGLALVLGGLIASHAEAQTRLLGFDIDYQLQGTYLLGIRLDEQDTRLIDAPPAASIPLPDFLKLPESNNFDDGNRSFDRYAPINNRATLLGELQFERDNYGGLVRADAFYDRVFRTRNDHDAIDRLNQTDTAVNEFTPEARRFSGRRARLLDAYVYGDWRFDNGMSLNLRAGSHIAAWGESLFFSGVALAQSPADATKANLAGADVKSILLPVNQVSLRLGLTNSLTLLGQYKLEHKPTEVNPPGEFFSFADIVGPGAEFIYGIRNPLFLQNLAEPNLLSSDLPEALQLIVDLLAPELPTSGATDLLIDILAGLDPILPDVNLPVGNIPQNNAPRFVNIQREADILPSDHGQYGVGLSYQVTPGTNLGLYRLRYHNTNPAPVQNYGDGALLFAPDGTTPLITTAAFGLEIPVTYNIRYFDGIDLSALSFSTTFLGANVGGEVILREGVDVLVDVDGGILGPVPTPTRADTFQALLSGLYLLPPRFFWDQLVFVGEAGYLTLLEVEEACGPTSCSNTPSFDREAYGVSMLAVADVRNIFPGWDLQIPVNAAYGIKGTSSQPGAFGALTGEGDIRAGIGFNFTRLQRLTVGMTYSGFFGGGDLQSRPLADRSNLAFTLRYALL